MGPSTGLLGIPTMQGFKSGCSKIQDSPSLLRLEATSWHIITPDLCLQSPPIFREQTWAQSL